MLPTLHVGEVQLSIWNVNALALQALRHLLRKKGASLLPQLGVDVTGNDADNNEIRTSGQIKRHVNYSRLEIPVVLLGLPGPGSNGFLTKGALEGICRLVLKVTVFAHSMFAW